MTTRRLFLAGAASFIAAPAIVRASSIMRVVMPKRAIITPANDELAYQFLEGMGQTITQTVYYLGDKGFYVLDTSGLRLMEPAPPVAQPILLRWNAAAELGEWA